METSGENFIEDNETIQHDSLDDISERVKRLSRDVADFVALQEVFSERMLERDEQREREFEEYRSEVAEQAKQVRETFNEFQEMLTSVGVARFRVSAESALAEGRAHLAAIQEQSERFKNLTEEGWIRFEQATMLAEKRVSNVVRSFRLNYFKKLVDDNCDRVEEVSDNAISKVSAVVKWFHWEKLGIALAVALVVSVVLGLFLNDEWPWETHHRVVSERTAGRELITAWPHLSKVEQQHIQKNVSLS